MKSNKQGIRVLFFGTILQLFLGILYVWSVFVLPASEALEWGVESAKLTSSFMLCFFVVGILAGGKLQNKIGPGRVVLIGGLMLSAGMFASSLARPSFAWLIYIAYGIVGGFGVGAGYNAVISSAQKWFPKNRGLATGVSVCAFGFSTVIFAPLVEMLIDRFGLSATFQILAAAFLVMVLSLFSFIKMPDDATAAAAAKTDAGKQFTTSEALRTKEFYFITISMMLTNAVFFILNPSFKVFAVERGLEAGVSTLLVMMTGIASALGRLAWPVLSDKLGRERTALGIIVLTALGALSLVWVQSYAFMAVVAVIAFCYGGCSGVYPVITGEYFGLKNVGSNYGAVMVGFAVSALTFPMLTALLPSVTATFITLACTSSVGAVLMLLLLMSKKPAK